MQMTAKYVLDVGNTAKGKSDSIQYLMLCRFLYLVVL